MKTTLTKTILALAVMATASMASAKDIPAWGCGLNFTGVSKGVQVLIGFSEFKGSGTLTCRSAEGRRVEYPITVTMKSSLLAPRISVGYMELYGQALQIALSNGTPEALLGNYEIVSGRVAVGAGAGVITAVRAAQKDLSLSISLQLVKGAGLELGFSKLKIELDPSRTN